MPSKKNKNDEEPVKPLSFYVKDRLELTKQLFSCLKSKQIKSRCPKNIQSKSMESIQQIVLDEILGISSKRLLSIINNKPCPADTESDSEIEHIELSDISSENDDDMMIVEPSATAQKEKANDKPGESSKSNSADPKPKTMLELIELEARARAIRSQLALEPVTKIELDDSEDEEVPEESPIKGPIRSNPPKNNSENSSKKVAEKSKTDKSSTEKQKKTAPKKTIEPPKKSIEPPKKLLENSKQSDEVTTKSTIDAQNKPSNERARKSPPPSKRTVVLKKTGTSSELLVISKQVPSAPPVKLKRNFSKTTSEVSLASTLEVPKTNEEPEAKQEITESRSSSPDIITMEQNIATFFVSDSEEDESEPPAKKKSPQKSPQKKSVMLEEKTLEVSNKTEVNANINEPTSQVEEKQTSPKSSQEIIPMNEEEIEAGEIVDQDESPSGAEACEKPDDQKLVETQTNKSIHEDDDDENVVNLMSDTEIDLNANSDKEYEELENEKPAEKVEEKSKTETEKNISAEKNIEVEKPAEVEYDDDVVEILNSDDESEELEKQKTSEKNSDEPETWKQRYLRSSAVKSILTTSKLTSKVRGKLSASKKSKASEKQNESKKKIEKEKEMTEKISKLEEGSIEQFQTIKESSNSGE